MAMKIAVTGANGFIGSHLTRALVAAGHQVRAMVQPGTTLAPIAGVDACIVSGDVLDPGSLVAAFDGFEVVLHLAAAVSDLGPRDLFTSVNIVGTENVVRSAAAAGARRVVLVSSLAVHAYTGWRDASEDAPRGGHHFPYGLSKIGAEDAVMAAHRDGTIEGVVIRPGVFPFGPGDERAWLPMCRAIRRGLPVLINAGRARLCTAYVENLCDGLRLAATLPQAAGRTYVVADGVSVTWRELLSMAAAELNAVRPRSAGPAWLFSPLAHCLAGMNSALGWPRRPPLTPYTISLLANDCHFGIDPAARELGYAPRVSLGEAVRRSAAWAMSCDEGKYL
jgi:nucleoside-diphosphate-sugar epimerase